MAISRATLSALTRVSAPFLVHHHPGKALLLSVRRCRCNALQPPDVPLLAQTARISLTTKEVEDFAPKIRQVIDWFGQLQAINLESVEPALGADTRDADNFRQDVPEAFEKREAMFGAVPSYDEPYIKVPKVLSKE